MTMRILLPAFLSLFAAGVASGQDEDRENGLESLSLKLETRAEKLLASQALHIVVRLSNDTRSDVWAWYPEPRILVAYEDGEFSEYRHPREFSRCVDPVRQTFAKGESEDEQIVVSDSEGTKGTGVFGKAGRYRIKATIAFRGKSLTSAELSVKVEEPSGTDALAVEFLRTKGLIGILGCDAHEFGSNKHIPLLQEFLGKHGETSYAPQVRVSLAIRLLKTLPDYWHMPAPPEVTNVLTQAWGALEPCLTSCPPELEPDMLRLAIRIKGFSGDSERADQLRAVFERKCSWHPLHAKMMRERRMRESGGEDDDK